MTLQQWQYALTVRKLGHFGKAAEACFVTQPTLSQQLQKLEEWLGVVLFDRSRQPVVPTLEGAKLLDQAQIALREFNKIEAMAKDDQGMIRGELHLGVIPTLAPYVLPLFLKKFLTAYKEVQLVIEELQTPEIVKRLIEETLDAGLLVTPLNEVQIREEPLFYERFFLYSSENHPILKKNNVQQGDLSTEEIFLMSEGHCFRDQALALCRSKKHKEDHSRLRIDSGSLNTLKKLVDQGHGYTLLPELALPDLLKKSEEKCVREFSNPIPYREISLVTHRHFVKEKLFTALKNEIIKNIPSGLLKEKPKNIIPI